MNALLPFETLFSESVVERLGWVLVHSLWQFAFVALLAGVTVRALRRSSAATRYGVLVVAMAVSVGLPVATWMLQKEGAHDTFGERGPLALDQQTEDSTNQRADATPLAGDLKVLGNPQLEGLNLDLAASIAASKSLPAVLPPDSAGSSPVPSWMDRLAAALRPWLAWIVAWWSIGVVVCSLRPLLGWHTLRRLQRVGISPVPDTVLAAMHRVSARLGVRRAVRVLQSTLTRAPVVIGYLRPALLLPISVATNLPPSQLEAILAHELAHVQRHDFVVNLLQTLFETLFFYHPAVWWLSHLIRVEREHCCDDLVVRQLGNRVEYGRALVAIEELRARSALLAPGAGDGSLLARIRRIVGVDHAASRSAATRQRSRWPALCLATACSLLALVAVRFGMNAAADQSRATAARAAFKSVAEAHREYEILSRLKAQSFFCNTDVDTQFMEQQFHRGRERPFAERRLSHPVRQADLWDAKAAGWPLIGQLRALERLHFAASDLRGQFPEVSRLENLREFSAVNCRLDPDDLAALKHHPHLEKIDVSFTVFEASDESITAKLGDLSAEEQQWLDRWLATRPAGSPNYRGANVALLTDRALRQLNGLKGLKTLKLINTNVSGRGLTSLAEMRQLEELDVQCLMLDVDAARIVSRFPALKSFQYANVSDDVLAELSNLPSLEQLTVWGQGVTDAGALSLSRCRKLRRLTLRASQISDAGLDALAELPDLRFLELIYGAADVTDAALQRFRERRPDCKLKLSDKDQEARAARRTSLQPEFRPTQASDGGVQATCPPLEFRFAANLADSDDEPRVPADFEKRHYPDNSEIGRAVAKDTGFVWIKVANPKDGKIILPLEGTRGSELRVALLADSSEHALLWDGTWSVEECRVVTGPAGDREFGVEMRLNEAGGKALHALTKSHRNQPLAIVVNGEVITAPTVRSEIGRDVVITGNFTREQANTLAAAIRADGKRSDGVVGGQAPESPSGAPPGGRSNFVKYRNLRDEDVETFVLDTVRTPFNPDPSGGSWQGGAYEMQVLSSLSTARQQDRVTKTLLKVIEGTEESTRNQRRLAMIYLGGHAPAEVTPLLIKALNAATLIPTGPDPTEPAREPPDRFAAFAEIEVLGRIGEEARDAIPVLLELLDHTEGSVHQAALQALVKVGPSSTDVINALSRHFDNPSAVYEAGRYGELAKPLGPKFVKLLDSKSKPIRIWAAQALVKSGCDAALGFEVLISDVAKGTVEDRSLAATALAALGSQAESVIPKLRAHANDRNERVAQEVRDAIRRIRTDDRIFTHAEEAAKTRAGRKAVAEAESRLRAATESESTAKSGGPSQAVAGDASAASKPIEIFLAGYVNANEKVPLVGLTIVVTNGYGQDQKKFGPFRTDEAGKFRLRLEPKFYTLRLTSEKELPFLPVDAYFSGADPHPTPTLDLYVTKSGVEKWLGGKAFDADNKATAEREQIYRLNYTLLPACELALRAVDTETGKGLPGAAFYMENAVGEYWAHAIDGDNLGAKSIPGDDRFDNEAYRTDKEGYFKRLVGPNSGYKYGVWRAPPGYEAIEPRVEVEIDTTYGKTRAEHNFKFRRAPERKIHEPTNESASDQLLEPASDTKDPLQRKVTLKGDEIPLRTALKKIAAEARLEAEFDAEDLQPSPTSESVSKPGDDKSQPEGLQKVPASDEPRDSEDRATRDDRKTADKPPRIRRWTAILVDGVTDTPLQGITLQARAAKIGEKELQLMTYKSEADGRVEVRLFEGTGTTVLVRAAGWFPGSFFIGHVPPEDRAKWKLPDPDPTQPVTIKLWTGTHVTGKLLTPDGKAAAGVALNVGVYIVNQEWKKRLNMDLGFYSFDHGDWANWSAAIVTDAEGTFETTVPPPDARTWVRVGTTGLAHAPISTAGLDADGPGKALLQFAPFEMEVGGLRGAPSPEEKGRLDFGTLKLERGAVLRGRVLDADGRPLTGVTLLTSGRHGPYAGRISASGEEGRFEFFPMNPGFYTLNCDARLRNEKGDVSSRDVQAVFLPYELTLPDSNQPLEIAIRAVPHVTVEFEWIDRRAKKGPVSYYGEFNIDGRVPRAGATPISWRGSTEKVDRDGRAFLVVKIPRAITNVRLLLPTDSIVTASYEDDRTKSGPGQVELGDVAIPRRRVIYGDEPKATIAAVPEAPDERAAVRPLGKLTGRFVYDGEPPPRMDLAPGLSKLDATTPLRRDSDGRVSGGAMVYQDFLTHGIRPKTEDASLLVGEDRGIANVVVWVVSKDIPWTPPKEAEQQPVTIRLKEGNYEPRIAVATVGQPLVVENHDPVVFNFHSDLIRNPSVNTVLPPRSVDDPKRWVWKQAEKLPARYQSDIGIWANGWLFIHGNPFVAVSGRDGSFTIPSLPPGEWEFRVWHERQGFVKHWQNGIFKQTIQPGENDLGPIKLKPEFFSSKPNGAPGSKTR